MPRNVEQVAALQAIPGHLMRSNDLGGHKLMMKHCRKQDSG